MRIGIDCIATDPDYAGGVNSYTFGLIEGFTHLKNDGNIFIIYSTPRNSHLFKKYNKLETFQVVEFQEGGNLFFKGLRKLAFFLQSFSLWEYSINKERKSFSELVNSTCNILYCPNTILSVYNLKVPTILSMHDIQQFHYPEFFSKNELILRKLNFHLSAKYSTFLQASSEFIKKDLLHHFPFLKQEQIIIITEGVDINKFRKNLKEIDLSKFSEARDKFLFLPAQLWKHKNHITILKALNVLKERGVIIPLIMTGAKYSAFAEINEYINKNNLSSVKYLGKVSFEKLVELYQTAHFFITAVLYESSSLPILEAAAAGIPIIASKTAPNIEMSSNIKMILFDSLDYVQLANMLEEIWNNEQFRVESIRQNDKNILLYSWPKIAEKYLDFFIKKVYNA